MKYDFLAPKAETYVIYILSTLLPIVNLAHIIFGTLVFSSLLFMVSMMYSQLSCVMEALPLHHK